MITKHCIIKDAPKGQLMVEYIVNISCDSCPAIIGFQRVSGEQLLALDGQGHRCSVCQIVREQK